MGCDPDEADQEIVDAIFEATLTNPIQPQFPTAANLKD